MEREIIRPPSVNYSWHLLGGDDALLHSIERELSFDHKLGKLIPNCGDAREYKAKIDKGTIEKMVYMAYAPSPSTKILYLFAISDESFIESLTEQQKSNIRRQLRKLFG